MDKVGKEGVITVEESKAMETTLTVTDGMQFDRGFISPHFVTDPGRMECVLEDPLILIHDKKISTAKELIPVLESIVAAGKPPLLVIAEEIDREALALLAVNKVRGALLCCAVRAPGFGERRKAIIEDIALLTGGEAVTHELGKNLKDTKAASLGRAQRVIVTRDSTVIVGGAGDKAKIDGRVREIRDQIQTTASEYDKEKLQERLAKLVGGVAVIHVGGATETEVKEKKDRVEDALHATRAAVEEGIVPGGGVALIRCIQTLRELKVSPEEQFGVDLVRRAIEEPARWIAQNGGLEGAVIVEKIESMAPYSMGFNAENGKFEDLIASGVIDPTKVVRSALQNAASVASLLLTTKAMVVPIPEKPDPAVVNS